MLRRTYPIVLITVAAWMTGCATTQQNANTATTRGHAHNPFVGDAEEMETPAILPRTHFAAGRLFEQQGLASKAIEQYRKAIAVGHDYVPAYHRLALLLSKTQRHKEAVQVLTRATLVKPGNAILRNNLGFEYAFLQDWAKAEREVRRAIKLKPDFARAHVNLGMILSRVGLFDYALVSFQKVLPESDAHYNLGLMFRSQQRYQDAAWAFNQAIEHDPQFTAAQIQLDQLMPKLLRMGIPDAKHARVQFVRPDPEGVYPKDALRLDTGSAMTTVFARGHAPSEVNYGIPRTQGGLSVVSTHPSEAAFRFQEPAPSANGALTRGNRFSRGSNRQGQWASGSLTGGNRSKATFAPPPLPDGSLVAFAPPPWPDGSPFGFAPPPLPDGSLFPFGTGSHPPSFRRSNSTASRRMASTVVGSQSQTPGFHRASDVRFVPRPDRSANARPTRRSNRTLASTIVPSMRSKLKTQADRIRKIRNRIRQLEKEFGDQLEAERTGSGSEPNKANGSSDESSQR